MTIDSTGTGGIRRLDDTSGEERAALEGMLKGYPVEQLVEEVLIAWQELAARNEEMVSVKQRLRVLSNLDLAEREDMVAPEVARLNQAEATLARERSEDHPPWNDSSVNDARAELASSTILHFPRRARCDGQRKLTTCGTLSIQQDEVIAELEGRIGQMVEALERAAEAGLTSVTAEEVRSLKSKLDAALMQNEAEQAANKALWKKSDNGSETSLTACAG